MLSFRHTVLFLALMGLAACGGGAAKEPPGNAAAKSPVSAAAESKKKDKVAIAPAEPPEPVNDDPQQFMGLDQPGVSAIIGKPAMIRRDGPAQVWQYRGPGCYLDIFMYRQDNDTFEVRYVDLRAPELAEDKHRGCLADLIRSNRQKPATS